MKTPALLLLTALASLPALDAHAQTSQTPVVQPPAHAHAQHPASKVKPKPKAAAPAATAPAPTPAPTPAPAPAPAAEEQPAPQTTAGLGSVSKLKLPYFMSFRFDDVNLRVGPGTNYPIDWVYHRRDLPVEILLELGDWRKIRDQDGIIGWVRAPSMWKRRSVVIREADRTIRAQPNDTATPVAVLKIGVVAHLRSCASDTSWCEVEINAYRGWLKRDDVYGIYPDEKLETP